MLRIVLPLSCFLAFVLAISPAQAADEGDIALSGSLSVEAQMDVTTNSDDPNEERTDLTNTTEGAVKLTLPKGFSVNGLAVLESVQDPAPGDDRYFEDMGVYIEELYLAWEQGAFGAKAGKFGQNFGIAWDRAPGIWGTDLVEDYEVAEQIGLGGHIERPAGPLGKARLSASTFFSDRTVLAESALTGRGTTNLSDGGPGNTDGFQSFALALDTEADDISFHFGWLHRGTGEAGKVAENGLAAGASGKFSLGPVSVAPLLEIARFEDREGTIGDTATYITTSAEFEWKGITLALSHTNRRANSVDDAQTQISAGYGLPYGFAIQAGYRRLEAAGIDSDTIGALLSWGMEF